MNTIYQDFHAEIIVTSIYEQILLLVVILISIPFVQKSNDKTVELKENRPKVMQGLEKKRIIIISIIPNGFSISHSLFRYLGQ